MAGKTAVIVTETVELLAAKLRVAKTAKHKERLQVLYCLKQGSLLEIFSEMSSVKHL